MKIIVREARAEDARAFLDVHRAAVRQLTAKDYPQAVIEDWAPLPITEDVIISFLANPDHELRFVAEIEGQIVGIGALVVENRELRACYVAPRATCQGVGAAIVNEIERRARKCGLSLLELDSSLTAESFYAAMGYAVRARGEHVLQSGQAMASVQMYKYLNMLRSEPSD